MVKKSAVLDRIATFTHFLALIFILTSTGIKWMVSHRTPSPHLLHPHLDGSYVSS